MKRKRIRSLPRKAFRIVQLSVRRRLFEEVLVLGDSHADVFEEDAMKSSFPGRFFHVVAVRGATVSGLENPNSKTQAYPTLMAQARRSKARVAIVLLGEVDTGFVIWYRAEKHGAPVARMLDKALRNYQKFLLELVPRFRVICISTPLPTIRDGQDWGEVANIRKNVQTTQAERTRLTLEFNRRMRDFCKKNGIDHLSLDERSLGPDGLVSPHLLNPDPRNHHYAKDVYAEMMVGDLQRLLGRPAHSRFGRGGPPRSA